MSALGRTGDPAELIVGIFKLLGRTIALLSKDDPASKALGILGVVVIVGGIVVLGLVLTGQKHARDADGVPISGRPKKRRKKKIRARQTSRSPEGDG